MKAFPTGGKILDPILGLEPLKDQRGIISHRVSDEEFETITAFIQERPCGRSESLMLRG